MQGPGPAAPVAATAGLDYERAKVSQAGSTRSSAG